MARTRTTIRRVDPWSILKFGFVVNLVLLGIELLAGAVVWAFIRRLELIEGVCDLAGSLGLTDCGVDGQALFDTVLVLGLLGVVIQTGIMVFLCFLANLIFDLTGGIVITLDDGTPGPSSRRVGSARRGAAKGAKGGKGTKGGSSSLTGSSSRPSPLGTTSPSATASSPTTATPSSGSAAPTAGGSDDKLFGG